MTSRRRSRALLAVLAATLLMSLVVTTADAGVPRATRYRVGGPITLDTNLLSASGVSAWAIDEYLKSSTSLPPLGAAFMAAERKYGINARFLLAAALHESGWGAGYIARVKHNLFGYNAYDRAPLRSANAYATYEANIDDTARFIKDFYLTRGGRWWGGAPTLRSMQQFWSSSHRWGIAVSQIATSIHLRSIATRSIAVAAPVVSGTLHGGDRASVRLTWAGGAIPAGVEFVAHWQPVELDAYAIAAASSSSVTGDPGAVDAATPATAPASPTPPSNATRVAARRVRTGTRSIALALAAPRQPGTYLLTVEMRDTGGGPLPAAQRVPIPNAEVRVWGDQALGYDLEPSPDGSGAVVRVTNMGRIAIPAIPRQASSGAPGPGAQARSVVTVTASAGDPANPAPVLLITSPLVADLPPGASLSFEVPGLAAATGRTGNWLTVGLSVPGDPAWLAAYPPDSVWFPGADTGATGPAGTAAPASVVASGVPPTAPPTPTPAPAVVPVRPSSPTPAPVAKPTPVPHPTPVPVAMPVPSPTTSVNRTPVATPPVAPAKPPAQSAKPAAAPVTRMYSERSSAIRYRGSWGDAAQAGYIGGGVAWSKTPGSSATLTFTGSSVSWLGPEGPTRGLALVLLDGRAVARVNLWRPSFVARAVLFQRTFRTAGRHTLTIQVLATPSHPYVAIDGFSVRS